MTAVEVHLIDAARVTPAVESALADRLTAGERARLPPDPQARRGALAVGLAMAQLDLRGRRVATASASSVAAIACGDVAHLGVDLETRSGFRPGGDGHPARFRPAERAWLARTHDARAAAIRLWCRKSALVQALAARGTHDPHDLLVLAPRVAVAGVTLALHDLPLPDPLFAALATPTHARPLPIRSWFLDDDGTLVARPAAARPAAPARAASAGG
jgi:hypothetical protein